MFVDMVYAVVTFPEIYPCLAVGAFVTLASLLGILVATAEWSDHVKRANK